MSGVARRWSALFGVPTFLGAALLFVVQPMLAKWLLPFVGGSPSTWTVCMLFFQTLLLAGYAYAHWTTGRLSMRGQLLLHLALIIGAALVLVFVPVTQAPELRGGAPELSIFQLLMARVGLPYFVLASTAPLLLQWAARVVDREAHPLYAISNAGSLVGLLAHPFLLEPALELGAEVSAWRSAFWVFGALTTLTLAGVWRAAPSIPPEPVRASEQTPTQSQQLGWLAWAFVPSVMLLAATHHLSIDVAPVPLLWVVPLCSYIVSFIVAFSVWRASWRGPVLALWVAGAVCLGVSAFSQASTSLSRQLVGTLLALFAACLLCHGELALARPATRRLTGYYLVIALGGALGGAFVSLVAPLIFADYYELEIGAVLVFVMLWLAARRTGPHAWPRAARLGLFLGAGLALPLLLTSVLVRVMPPKRQGRVIERSRSFLGPLRVVELPYGRTLTHGHIQHGLQLAGPALSRTPTLNFGPGTAIAQVLQAGPADHPRRLGIIGLGIGTLAAYGRPGDELRFYELDPRIISIAQRDFTFLADSAATITTSLGDGRLSLEREPPRAFDVLVLDAFSSDAVPVHLLTKEAFAIYLRHLAPTGVLLAHISNRFLALEPVVRGSARANGLSCLVVETGTDAPRHVTHAEWALLAREPDTLARLSAGLPTKQSALPEVLWTDARASLLPIMRWARSAREPPPNQ